MLIMYNIQFMYDKWEITLIFVFTILEQTFFEHQTQLLISIIAYLYDKYVLSFEIYKTVSRINFEKKSLVCAINKQVEGTDCLVYMYLQELNHQLVNSHVCNAFQGSNNVHCVHLHHLKNVQVLYIIIKYTELIAGKRFPT